ncbi:hypothetical protein AcW1_007293 [Taiwanofungus camphoratus]|nr:hypothetical protein AcW1_007293 [Antrodia cinnamomea]
MARFNEVNYNSKTGAVDIGPGLIWDDVYAALEPYGVNVVGGRVTGVGVAGFILGGGYSHKSNQYGLAIDTVQAYELVLPNGTITTVTDESNPDLFFALKGGFNNFGIVTKFTLKVFPQTEVWGGAIIILGNENQVNAATAKYAATVTDPKATLLTTYNWDLGLTIVELDLFYDAPTPPPGIFDDFLAIPALDQDISTRSFLSLVLTTPSNSTAGKRGFFHTVPLVNITPSILDAVVNESQYWADQLALTVPGLFISYDVEPFLPNVFSHGTPSAYPPSRTQGLFPMNIYYAWTFSASDAVINTVMQQTANTLTEKAIAEGQNIADAALYPNYAIYDTPLERMYGENMPTLQNLKNQYDPNNVMGLAGGWKF